MGVFTRPDSPWWWIWLETSHTKEKTAVRIGTTAQARHDSRLVAQDVYQQRMHELARRVHRLPLERPAIRFTAYAATYQADVIAHHRGDDRERELLKSLIAGLGDELLTSLDVERVRQYMTRRRAAVSATTVNREIDLLKSMLREAVPKYLEASPIAGLKRLQIQKPKRRLMTHAEEHKLLAAAKDPADRALIINALDSLVRLGELLNLRREDRHGRWIYLRDPKNNEPCEVALSVRGAKALDQIKNAGPYFFEKFRGAKTKGDRRRQARKMFYRLCEQAGLKYGRKDGGLTFHWATRRTGATRMLVERRVPVPAVQRQGNWKTPEVLLQIYAEADKRALLQAVAVPTYSRFKRKPQKQAAS